VEEGFTSTKSPYRILIAVFCVGVRFGVGVILFFVAVLFVTVLFINVFITVSIVTVFFAFVFVTIAGALTFVSVTAFWFVFVLRATTKSGDV